MKVLDEAAAAHPDDPGKLATLKKTLRQQEDSYFTCLLYENIPVDNNKAERGLRPLVIKRKISFGSKTQKGANVTAVLASVILSLWWKGTDNFFGEWKEMRGA